MSGKKNLLNEAQVRKFMKLASLEPLAHGFVNEMNYRDDEEELDELRTGVTGALGPKSGRANPGHGRGQGEAADGSLFEQEADPEALEDYAMGDEERGEPEEAGEDELEADIEMEPEAGPGEGRMVSVDDFLAALETALEDAIGDEVEIDSDEMEDEEEVDEFAPEGEDVVADDELGAEDEMMEGFEQPKSAGGPVNTHKGSKQHPDHRRTKNSKGGLASQGPGLVKEEDDDDDDADESPRKGEKLTRSGKGRGEKKGDEAYVNEATDDLVEQITKRVAARILKSALKK
jgi:hypothetical protein